MEYSISEAAKKIGVSPHTLRYYDKEGLLPFVERDKSGNRVFKNSDFFMLYIIECMKTSGMPLKEIKNYIDLYMRGDETMKQRREVLALHQERVKQKISELKKCLSMLKYQLWYYDEALEHGSQDIHHNRGRAATHRAYEENTGETAPWPNSEVFTDNYNLRTDDAAV